MRATKRSAPRWAGAVGVALAVAFLAAGVFAPRPVEAAAYIVTMPDDVVHKTGCLNYFQGGCSLRDAINGANHGTAAATIRFDVHGTPVINVGSTGLGPLPAITAPVSIDGTTQYGGRVWINGASAGADSDGLRLLGGDSTVSGLAVYGFSGNGIKISGPGGSVIMDNYIGTSDGSTGGTNRNGGHGVFINGSPDNIIGPDNVLSNNGLPEVLNPPDPPIPGTISDGVRIEGATATGNAIVGNHIGTELTGTSARRNTGAGVRIQDASGNTVGGMTVEDRNIISGNGTGGVLITGTTAGQNTVRGNYIGTSAAGGVAIPNGADGVLVDGAPGVTIGGTDTGAQNVISGNPLSGVHVKGGATGVVVAGNLIGTDATGGAKLGNGGHGVWLESVSGNTIGGTEDGARNVISGNGGTGVEISATASGDSAGGNSVIGNYIGTNAGATAAFGNGGSGVRIAALDPAASATGNTIGETDAGAGNVISGNGIDGVEVSGASASGNTVAGNRIGTDASGMLAAGNAQAGVRIENAPGNTVDLNVISSNGLGVHISGAGASGNAAHGNVIGTTADGSAALGNANEGVYIEGSPQSAIGGTAAGAGNVIAGNGASGVRVKGADASANILRGNYIGTNRTGAQMPDGGDGVLVEDAPSNTIGGPDAGAKNRIAYNTGNGVAIVGASASDAVRGNDVSSNGGLGIDLGGDGVTPNDPGDTDNGANGLQNFPVLTAAVNPGVHITGSLDSAVVAPFTIDFFSSSQCDTSGYGEGQHYLGSAQVTTDATGAAGIDVSFPENVYTGDVVAATATDVAGNTSEFSACVTAAGPVVPTPTPISSATPTPAPTPTPVPTPTPTPSPVLQGDVNCDGAVDTVDALAIQRFVATLSPLAQHEPCPDVGSQDGGRIFGDVGCDGAVDTVDSLRVLRHVAGFPPLAAPPGCPAVGT